MSLSRKFIHIPRHKWAIWQMQRSGLNDLFKARDPKALLPQAFDLWFLYRQILKQKPMHVVEYGIGNSTLVMAQAMAATGWGNILSIDADQGWIDDTMRCVPDRLRPFISTKCSTIQQMQIDGERCHRFAEEPPHGPIDFMFLDGPAPKNVPGWIGKPISADPVLLEERFSKSKFRMVVDSRLDNVAFLKKHLKRRYRVKTDEIFGITTLDLMP